jgi:very-short-patch-repair endonuclease
VALHLPSPCQDLLDLQHGVIARWQAARGGLNVRTIDAWLRSDRWRRLYDGVYATQTGQPSRRAVLWAGVLRAGPGAALGYNTAAELDGLADRPSNATHVVVSSSRRVIIALQERGRDMPQIVVHYSARIEETTIDLTQVAPSLDEAFSWLARACSRRLTTPALLHTAMTARPKLRWRTELTGALADVRSGAHSALEWRYLRDVELRHGLPRAVRQSLSQAGNRTRYMDNKYPEFGLVVELDGRAAHPVEKRWRDIHRDNVSAAAGMVTLRYNWADITTDPCRVASEVAAVLRRRGWTGRLRPCGPGCTAAFS